MKPTTFDKKLRIYSTGAYTFKDVSPESPEESEKFLLEIQKFTNRKGLYGSPDFALGMTLWNVCFEGKVDLLWKLITTKKVKVEHLNCGHPFHDHATPLHAMCMCVSDTDLDKVYQGCKLLLENGADVNAQDDDGYTALHFLLYKNVPNQGGPSLQIIELFMVYGCDWDLKTKEHQYTPKDFVRNFPPIEDLLKSVNK